MIDKLIDLINIQRSKREPNKNLDIMYIYLFLLSRLYLLVFFMSVLVELTASQDCLPDDFQFLEDAMQLLSEDQKILQDIRYYSAHNFMGRRVEGYNYPGCILQAKAIQALLEAQKEALTMKLTGMVISMDTVAT